MADIVANIALGRAVEFYVRVKGNDPANSALVIVVLATAGLESDAVLKDKEDLAALVAGTTNEVTNTGYARKVLTDSDLVAYAPDHANDRAELVIPDQTWTGVASGDGWSKFCVCYDPDTTGGTDSDIIPITLHDAVFSPDGSDITVTIPASGFFRAS